MSTGKSFRQKLGDTAKRVSWKRIAIAALTTICILQSLAIFLFPDGLPLQVDGGSLPDWAAAVGTLLVGLMAWRISVRSHQHNEFVQNESRERTRRTDAAVLRQFKVEVAMTYASTKTILSFKNLKNTSRDEFVRRASTYSARYIDIDKWRDVLPLLNDDQMKLVQTTKVCCVSAKYAVEIVIASFKGKDTAAFVDQSDGVCVDHLHQQVEELQQVASDLADTIRSK